MSIFNTAVYEPPGVYTQSASSPLVNVVGINTSIIALVGPTRGYQVQTDGVVISPITPVFLSQAGVIGSSVVVTSTNGTVYSPSSDYVLTIVPGLGGNPYLATAELLLATNTTISLGSTVYVTYNYTNADYFTPQLFTQYNALAAMYGNPINLVTNVITSPISLAAQIAYTNGATSVIVCPTTDMNLVATRAGLSAAYASLAAYDSIDIIVPLPVGISGTAQGVGDVINTGVDLATHCDTMAAQGVYRVGIIGYETTVTVGPDIIAQGIVDARVMEAWPNQMNYFNGLNNTTLTVGGYYLAAAYAGYLANQPVQTNLTKKTISGFSGIPNTVFQTMTSPYKNQLSAAGVAVLESNSQGLQCRHGVTTDPTSINTRELSLVRSTDAMVDTIQLTLDASGLIGSAFTVNTVQGVQNVVQAALSSVVQSGVIMAYRGLTAAETAINPTIVTVTFGYQPAYPLNYIVAIYTVNTSTGTVTPSTTQANG